MMPSQEPSYPCPKCGQHFPLSQMNAHYVNCQGRPVQQAPAYIPQMPVQNPVYPTGPQSYQNYPPQGMQAPLYIPPHTPKHIHQWFENDTYKVCLDQSCKEIKPKLKGSWMIFTRYALKIFVIELIIAFAIAFSAASALGVHR